MGQVKVIEDLREAYRWTQSQRIAGKTIGLVPTMGALHEGHTSLVKVAKAQCDSVVASIFVNPTQFAPNEDFAKYPRTLDDDLAKLSDASCDVAFVPSLEEMFPAGASAYVEPPSVSRRWEGEWRPGHFRGVATVVVKLFQIIPADRAYFGQKDYQQTRVIAAVIRDLGMSVELVTCPTLREPSGLAMSSRNRYLSADDLNRAQAIYASLRLADEQIRQGATDPTSVIRAMHDRLWNDVEEVDYATLVDAETLEPLETLRRPFVALIACKIGGTRLIDNWLWA